MKYTVVAVLAFLALKNFVFEAAEFEEKPTQPWEIPASEARYSVRGTAEGQELTARFARSGSEARLPRVEFDRGTGEFEVSCDEPRTLILVLTDGGRTQSFTFVPKRAEEADEVILRVE